MHQKINYKLIISILALISSISIPGKAYAQIFGGEQNPFSVNWRQINTSGFKIIYPVEMESEAQRMANNIRYIFPKVGRSLNVKKTTIPIIFQNQGVIANGFVQLGPKKSEFNTTPPQSFDSQDWLNNLAVHELLRHVAQFDKLTNGRPYPFPEEVYFAWMGVSIPLWFFEGDAVSNETSLTHAGRGRQPSWIMPYRTALLQGKNLSYSKANFGSQKDVTPGYYQIGYLLASHIRAASGKFVFDSVLTDIKKRPLRIYPFAGSLKKFSSKTGKQWYSYTSAKLKADWEKQAQLSPSKDYPVLNQEVKYATDYSLPVQISDGRILVLKQSKALPAAFTLIDKDKKEHRIQGIGQQEQPWFSYAKDIVAWDEIRYDPRFQQRSYSVICTYNLQTKKVRQLSKRSRIFSPTLSADGSKIVAVEIDLSNKVQLIVMDAASGKIIRSYPNPGNLLLQTPAFNSTGTMITYIISVTEKGKALWTVDNEGKTEKIISETQQQLSRPVFIGSHIAFNAHYNGINNIYDINPISKKINALSASKYGAFNPSVINGTDSILFNSYNLFGYEVTKTKIEEQKTGKDNFVFFGEAAEKQENTGNVFDNIPDSSFTSAPYRKLGHLINIHSIIPVIADEYKGGLQLRSNNLLNTFDAYAGVNYQRDLGRFEYNAGASFKSLYPIFNVSFTNRPRRTFYNMGTGTKQGDWRENYVKLQAIVPLNLSAQNHNYNFSVNAGTSYTQRYDAQNMPSNFVTFIRFPLETGFTFTHTIRSAERDIAPRWAQVLKFNYFSQPFDKQLSGDLFAAAGFFYFPGLGKKS
ncbi:TolB family protein [Pedobacter sp. NJ-S-72]